jgi:hypothetical protein
MINQKSKILIRFFIIGLIFSYAYLWLFLPYINNYSDVHKEQLVDFIYYYKIASSSISLEEIVQKTPNSSSVPILWINYLYFNLFGDIKLYPLINIITITIIFKKLSVNINKKIILIIFSSIFPYFIGVSKEYLLFVGAICFFYSNGILFKVIFIIIAGMGRPEAIPIILISQWICGLKINQKYIFLQAL